METERIETVIIGGGQAGLSTGYHLARRGRPFVILDGNARVGDNWRSHWDSLRLYSPARYDGLPGMPFPAPAWSFPTKDEVAAYLAAYAAHFELPVRGGVRVDRLLRDGERRVVVAGERRFEADNVVVATGTFGRAPRVPDFAADLGPEIRQLHSSGYRNPAQLAEGPVLVVGASHSGADVAYEVAAAHRTYLCGRDTGQIPFAIEGRMAHAIFPLLWLMWTRVLNVRTPVGRKMRGHVRAHGGPLLRVKGADLAAAGVERITDRMTGVRDGKPVLADGRVLDVANVVWCTGFRQDFSWIDQPALGEDGWPEDEPGLYYVGLAFQRAFSSMLVGGVGRDADLVAQQIARRATPDGAGSVAARAGSRGPAG